MATESAGEHCLTPLAALMKKHQFYADEFTRWVNDSPPGPGLVPMGWQKLLSFLQHKFDGRPPRELAYVAYELLADMRLRPLNYTEENQVEFFLAEIRTYLKDFEVNNA